MNCPQPKHYSASFLLRFTLVFINQTFFVTWLPEATPLSSCALSRSQNANGLCADSACSRSNSANRCISSRICTAVSCRTVSRRGSGADSGTDSNDEDENEDEEDEDEDSDELAMANVASEE